MRVNEMSWTRITRGGYYTKNSNGHAIVAGKKGEWQMRVILNDGREFRRTHERLRDAQSAAETVWLVQK